MLAVTDAVKSCSFVLAPLCTWPQVLGLYPRPGSHFAILYRPTRRAADPP